MAFTPAQVGAMALWKFAACVDGYNRANSSDDTVAAPSAAEFAAAKAAHGDN